MNIQYTNNLNFFDQEIKTPLFKNYSLKLGKSIGTGLLSGLTTCGVMFTGFMVSDSFFRWNRDIIPLTYALSAVASVGVAAKTFYNLSTGESNSSKPISDLKMGNPLLVEPTNISKLATSLGKGWKVYAPSLGLTFILGLAQKDKEGLLLSLIGSSMLGMGAAATSYYSLSLPSIFSVKQNIPILSHIAKSFGVGLIDFAASLAIGAIFAYTTDFFGNNSKPIVISGSTLCGVASSILKYIKLNNKDPIPPVKRNVVTKFAMSTFAGLHAAAVSATITYLSLYAIDSSSWGPIHIRDKDIKNILIASMALGGCAGFYQTTNLHFGQKLFDAVFINVPEIPQAAVNDAAVINSKQNNLSTLLRLAKSFGSGWASYASTLVQAGWLFKVNDIESVLPWAAAYGLLSAYFHYKPKKVVDLRGTPFNTTPVSNDKKESVEKTHFQKISSAVFSAINPVTAILGTFTTANLAANRMGYDLKTHIIGNTYLSNYIAIISIITGIGVSLKSLKGSYYPDLRLRPEMQWRNMSKKKRAAMVTASLVGMLGVSALVMGPDTVSDHLKAGALTMYGAGEVLFTKILYTTKHETTTKKLSEWIAEYSPEEEAVRLMQLGLEGDATCAEILQTCHLQPEDQKGHKAAYKQKLLKVHPDKLKGEEELATQAALILNAQREYLNNCTGQTSLGCNQTVLNLTGYKELHTQRWLYAKINGANPRCYIGPNKDVLKETKVEYCSNLV